MREDAEVDAEQEDEERAEYNVFVRSFRPSIGSSSSSMKSSGRCWKRAAPFFFEREEEKDDGCHPSCDPHVL